MSDDEHRIVGAAREALLLAKDAQIARLTAERDAALAGAMRVLEFGQGKLVITTGYADKMPAVFICAAKEPGEVGSSADRENNPRDALVAGEMVLTFPADEQAKTVADALVNALEPAEPSISAAAKVLLESKTVSVLIAAGKKIDAEELLTALATKKNSDE